MHPITIILMTAITALAFLLLRREGLLRSKVSMIVGALFLIGAFGARLFVINHETLDYQHFLAVWVQHFRDHGGFAGFAIPVGNYNVVYLYFLALFSYLPMPDLHLIKLLSIFFDVILAYYVMRIVGLPEQNKQRKTIAFFTILYLPTVFLNGAYWGQCDVIYATFAVMSVYYALSERPLRAMVTIALALSFKLQAIFIFPLYLIFLATYRIRLRHLPVFPLTYFAAILPAVLLGRPFWDTLLFYVSQADTTGRGLVYNAPSVFAFARTWYNPQLAMLGIAGAVVFVLLVYLLTLSRKRRRGLTKEDLLVCALLFAVGVPLFLPQMHDRYFFLADVFAVALGLSRLKFLPAIALTQFASLLGYHAYLRQAFLLPMHYGAIALLILTGGLLLALLLRRNERRYR